MSALAMWVVYDHPRDHPEHYIARRWEIAGDGETRATASCIFSRDYSLVREQLLHMGLTRLERMPGDDANIMETWL